MQEHHNPMTSRPGLQDMPMYSDDPEVVPFQTLPGTLYEPSHQKQADHQPFLPPAPTLSAGYGPYGPGYAPGPGYSPQSAAAGFGQHEKPNQPPGAGAARSRRTKITIGVLAVILVLAVGLGIGLGVGLGLRKHSDGDGGGSGDDGKGNNNDNDNGNNNGNSTSSHRIDQKSTLTAVSFRGPEGATQRVVFYQDNSNALHVSRFGASGSASNQAWAHVNVTDKLLGGGAEPAAVIAKPGTVLSAVARYVSTSSDYDDGQPRFRLLLYYVAAGDGTIVQVETNDVDSVADWSVGEVTGKGITPVEGSTFSAHYARLFWLPSMSHSLFVQTQDNPGQIRRWADGPNGTDKNSWLDTGVVTSVQEKQVGGRGALMSAISFATDLRLYYTDKARVTEMWPDQPVDIPWQSSMEGGTANDAHLEDNLSNGVAAVSFDDDGGNTNILLARHGTNGQGIPIAWHDGKWRTPQNNPAFTESGATLPASIKGDANNSTALAFSSDLSAWIIAPRDGDNPVPRVWRFQIDPADPRTWQLVEEVPTDV